MRYKEIMVEAAKTLRLYHASPADIDHFAPLTHFGTRAAALARGGAQRYQGSTMKLYEVDFFTRNPVRVLDLGVNKGAMHTWSNLTDMLHYTARKITSIERDSIYRAAGGLDAMDAAAGTHKLIEVLQAHGWDAVVYRNMFEDAYKDSWINLTIDQVRVVRVEPISAAP